MPSLREPMLEGAEEPLTGQWCTNDQAYHIVQDGRSLDFLQSLGDGTCVGGELRPGPDGWLAAALPHGDVRLRPAGRPNLMVSQFRPARQRYYFGTRVARKLAAAERRPWWGLCRGSRPAALVLAALLVLADAALSEGAGAAASGAHFAGRMWEPVKPVTGSCLMAPPQPFYFEAGAAMIRTFLMAIVVRMPSVMQWGREYPRSNWEFAKSRAARAYLVYQICSIPVSLGLVLQHWRQSTSDPSCLSAMFVNAPYMFNALISLAQYAIGAHYLRHMRTWSRGARRRDERWREGVGGCVERKQSCLRVLALVNAVLVGVPSLLVAVLHLLPGLLQPTFAAQFVLVASSGGAITWLLGGFAFWRRASGAAVEGEKLKRTSMAAQRYELMSVHMISDGGLAVLMSFKPAIFDEVMAVVQATSVEAVQEMAEAEEEAKNGWTFAIFFFVPLFVSIRVAVEVLFCEVMYFRSGLTAWEASRAAWCERRIVVFATSLARTLESTSEDAVWQLWSGLQLLLEWV